MDRRQFLSRFFSGVAVASIAPSVIAKVCEEHPIAKGTVFSFGQRIAGFDPGYGGDYLCWAPARIDGSQIQIDCQDKVFRLFDEVKFDPYRIT